MTSKSPILVTGAAGNVGAVGRLIVQMLREWNLPVRALVHRLDERSQVLANMGAEVVLGDLTSGKDVARCLRGCQRMFFTMSISPSYLQATVVAAAAAKEIPNFEAFVNISQMTVSQMTLTNMTDSPQQQQHWLAEQVLKWSGLPVVYVRPTIFLEHPFFSILPAASIAKNGTIQLPFGKGRTSPISAYDVARVIATILKSPKEHIGKVYELTGPRSEDMMGIAKEYEEALHRPVKYVNAPFENWRDEALKPLGLPSHLYEHLLVMAQLHAQNRYDRLTHDVEKITGKPAMSIREYVTNHPEIFSRDKVPSKLRS